MSSPINPVSDPAHLSVMFWLPPGGTDNGVWASYWAELADLEAAYVGPLLQLLAQAGVGGYVATPGGHAYPPQSVIHRLWVDSLQYHRAEEVLMSYLRTRSQR
jgi:hypothetical protein